MNLSSNRKLHWKNRKPFPYLELTEIANNPFFQDMTKDWVVNKELGIVTKDRPDKELLEYFKKSVEKEIPEKAVHHYHHHHHQISLIINLIANDPNKQG